MPKTTMSRRELAELIEFWQRHHPPLVVDGIYGGNTQASVRGSIGALEKVWPLRALPDGRKPIITSAFGAVNDDRPDHDGADMFYRWLDGDPLMDTGEGGAIMRNGKRRWWIPPGTCAVSAAPGIVGQAGETATGWRCWVEHGDGHRTGYFHGKRLLVKTGQFLAGGEPVIEVGDNPSARDKAHLHFEVSPIRFYAPMNPAVWLRGAEVLEAGKRLPGAQRPTEQVR